MTHSGDTGMNLAGTGDNSEGQPRNPSIDAQAVASSKAPSAPKGEATDGESRALYRQTPDTPMPLDTALRKFFPEGGLSKAALLAAIRRGELSCERIGRSYFVTAGDISEWRSKCRARGYRPGSGSGAVRGETPDGSLSMDERKSTLAAALAITRALRKGSANTSPPPVKSTRRAGTRLRLVSQTS